MHSHHKISMDQCAYQSGIRNWKPEGKLFFSMLAIGIIICTNHFWISCFTFIFMSAVSIGLGKISPGYYAKAVRVPLLFIVLGSIAIGVQFSGEAQGIAWLDLKVIYAYVTKRSLTSMLLVMMKALGGISAMYLITLSTPAGELIAAIKKLPLPALFIELMHLIYRYIFLLLDAQQKMRYAAESRMGYIDFSTSCKSFGKIMGNLLLVSLQRSRTYYDAMESRCYDETCTFYQEERIYTVSQICSFVLYLAGVIVIFVLTGNGK